MNQVHATGLESRAPDGRTRADRSSPLGPPPSTGRSASRGQPEQEPAPPPPRRRWLALDLFRFLAVLSMVQGHTFYVTLVDAVRSEPWYRWHAYVHGYTAPVFLFAAGLSFGIATLPRWDKHLSATPTVRKRFERYGILLLIAYLLQIPRLDLGLLFGGADQELLQRILKVDALQHIGISLVIAQALIPVCRTRRRFLWTIFGLLVASVSLGPAIWRLPVEDALHPFFAAYVNDHTGSIFPWSPWSGFIYGGILVAWALLELRVNRSFADVTAVMAIVAGLLIYLGYLLDHIPAVHAFFGDHNFWKTGPPFFLWRLGVVLLVLACLGLVDVALERSPRGRRLIHPLEILGQESLVLYVTHLMILYGSPLAKGLVRYQRRSLDLEGSLVAFAAVWVAVCAVGFLWVWLRGRHPGTFLWLKRGLWGLVVYYAVRATFF
jgi:uncharacterized membrane protein